MNEIDLIADKYHEKMKEEIKTVCPKCGHRLRYEDLGDDDVSKPCFICDNCDHIERCKDVIS